MATQWGRDNNFQPGGKRGSAGLIMFVMILSLALGAAGGYAAFRYTQPEISAPLDDPGPDVAELNEALDVALKDLDQARAAQAASAAEVKDLKAQTARQAADLDAMAEKLAAISTEAQPPQDNSAALEALSRARDALTAENDSLKTNPAALEAERDALSQNAGAAEARLAAELARLNDQVLPELTAERDQLQRKIAIMLADQETLKARAKAAAESKASDAPRILELETRLAETDRKLTAAQQALAAIKLEQPTASEPDIIAEPAEPEPAATAPDTTELAPRDANAVAAALRSAPGLGVLSEEDRQKLTDMLVAGECVTTALESVFDRVPILTLRNLIRDLNSDC